MNIIVVITSITYEHCNRSYGRELSPKILRCRCGGLEGFAASMPQSVPSLKARPSGFIG